MTNRVVAQALFSELKMYPKISLKSAPSLRCARPTLIAVEMDEHASVIEQAQPGGIKPTSHGSYTPESLRLAMYLTLMQPHPSAPHLPNMASHKGSSTHGYVLYA